MRKKEKIFTIDKGHDRPVYKPNRVTMHKTAAGNWDVVVTLAGVEVCIFSGEAKPASNVFLFAASVFNDNREVLKG